MENSAAGPKILIVEKGVAELELFVAWEGGEEGRKQVWLDRYSGEERKAENRHVRK